MRSARLPLHSAARAARDRRTGQLGPLVLQAMRAVLADRSCPARQAAMVGNSSRTRRSIPLPSLSRPRRLANPWADVAADVFEGLDPVEPFTTAKLNQNCPQTDEPQGSQLSHSLDCSVLCFELSLPRVPITWEANASAAGPA